MLRDNIYEILNAYDIYKGEEYDESKVVKTKSNWIEINNKESKVKKIYYFKVKSENVRNKIYNVSVLMDCKIGIVGINCECKRFEVASSCKHVAAAIHKYYNDIFLGETNEEKSQRYLNEFFDFFEDKYNEKKNIKKGINIEIHLENGYDCAKAYLKIGLSKLYIARKNKLRDFIRIYKEEDGYSYNDVINFSKTFQYNSKDYFFNKNQLTVLDYFINIIKLKYYGVDDYSIYNKRDLERLVRLCLENNIPIFVEKNKIEKIINEFPIGCSIKKENQNYILNTNLNDEYILNNIMGFCVAGNIFYIITDKQADYINYMEKFKLKDLIFTEEYKKRFVNIILPIIKENIKIDENVDIVLSKDIKAIMYFDFLEDIIVCNLKFKYNNIEVDFFEKNDKVIKDIEFENSILEKLQYYNFKVENKKIIMDDMDYIGEFIETGLDKLSKDYDIYTTENFKKNKVKKTNITSTFSIGRDNIMSYSFDLGNIDPNELEKLMESLRNNKKYYKLKSGDLVNLENDKFLNELSDLQQDLDISIKDIKKGGVIPKYRAIYLDSIKNERYHIIKTNNLFDELIEKYKNYKDANIVFDEEGNKILRDYQKFGVKWLYNIDKSGFGGILADEMGLGKSIQTIYYIKEMLKENKDYKFLIVVPTSLAFNWENEIIKFGKGIKYTVIVDNKSKRDELIKTAFDNNVIITTYGLLNKDKDFYESCYFKTMIIDEAQAIKNPTALVTKECKKINAETKIALTGTPIENNVTELWSIFDYIMPGFLNNLDKFNKKYKIKDFDEDSNKKIANLNKIVTPFILRRRKKDVVKELPNKIENNIYVDMTEKQKKLYVAELTKVNQEMETIMHEEGITKARFLILQLLTKLRQICIDPRIISSDYNGGSGKIDEFVNIVKELVGNNRKCLVFTSFKTALEIAKNKLDEEGITSYTIDGTVPSKRRMELVDSFNKDSTNVFFIMLRAGGNGLNLTAADAVIHLDLWWNPQVENQATDRAHRIGQKKVVDVIRLVTTGTIEEKILELQKKKKVLAEKLIEEENDHEAFNKLTEKDIKELLSIENSDK